MPDLPILWLIAIFAPVAFVWFFRRASLYAGMGMGERIAIGVAGACLMSLPQGVLFMLVWLLAHGSAVGLTGVGITATTLTVIRVVAFVVVLLGFGICKMALDARLPKPDAPATPATA